MGEFPKNSMEGFHTPDSLKSIKSALLNTFIKFWRPERYRLLALFAETANELDWFRNVETMLEVWKKVVVYDEELGR